MQAKIIFYVLFMLSFTVAHDTFINIIHSNDHASISHSQTQEVSYQECEDMDEIHGMFHFVGLFMSYKNSFIQLPTKPTLSYDSFQYSPPFKESSYKPPKA